MFNGNLYYLYLYILVITVLPTTVVLKNEYGGNPIVFNSNGDQSKNMQFLMEDTGKLISTLTKAVRRTFTEFEQLSENILDIVSTNVPKITRDAEMFLAKLSNRTIYVFNAFNNKIQNDVDLLREMFFGFEHQLESVRFEFQNLAISVDEHFNWAVNQLNHTLISNNEDYELWLADIKQKLLAVNNTKLHQEGCHAIDLFIITSAKELNNCCKLSMKPMRSLCKSTSSLITEALHTIVNVIDEMQACLEDKNSYLDYMLPCINLAYDEITSLVSRAVQITHQINNMLPMKIIYTRSCFSILKVDMNVRRNDIEFNLFSDK